MEDKLDAEVRGLLIDSKGEWLSLSKRAGVSYSWISKFVNGHIPNPGYNTLKRLQKQLAHKKARHDERR